MDIHRPRATPPVRRLSNR